MYMKHHHLLGKLYLLKRTAPLLWCPGKDREDLELWTAVREQNQLGRHTNAKHLVNAISCEVN